MKFGELIEGLDLADTRGDFGAEVADIECDSRFGASNRASNWGFVALKGASSDGHDFVPQALAGGASCVFSERALPGAKALGAEPCTPDASGAEPCTPDARASAMFTGNPRETMAILARRVHGCPDLRLPLIGVTGTNGKTTTSMLIRQLLMASGLGCGLIGTVLNAAGGLEEEAVRTSPESTVFYRWAKRSLDAGDAALAVEVSSHALDLARVHGAHFRVGVFTNLTQDHLDFHENMDAYFRAKAKLFAQCACGLVNVEDEYGRRLLAENPSLVPYGLDEGAYRAESLALRHDGTSFTLVVPQKRSHLQNPQGFASHRRCRLRPAEADSGASRYQQTGCETQPEAADGRERVSDRALQEAQRYRVDSPLLGRFNAYNLLAALAALDMAGFDLNGLLPNICAVKGAPGRLERVDMGQPFGVMIDYAHTPDALEKLLGAGKALLTPGGRLHVLFGCGGDRDRTKRPMMARAVVAGGADVIWHTSDNTRTEDPERMLDDASIGIPAEIRADAGRYHRIADRALAVAAAVADCRPGDLLLLAGKGHEPYQDVMGVKHPYSDRAAVEAALRGEEIPRPWAVTC